MADHSIKGKTVLIAGGAKNLGGLIARDLQALAQQRHTRIVGIGLEFRAIGNLDGVFGRRVAAASDGGRPDGD